MRVYVAERCYYYEGTEVIGVFLSRDAAEVACKYDADKYGDFHQIEEFEVEDSIEES